MTFLVLVILLLFKFGLISLLDHGLWTRKSQVQNQKFGFKNLERYIKIEKKNLHFNGIKQSKLQWMVVEIKFMKGENFKQKVKKWPKNF